MKWFAKIERKFGRYAISNLMRYMTAISIAGAVLGIIQPGIYYSYLSLNVYAIIHGQVWRLVTFLMYPSLTLGPAFFVNLIFYALMLYVFLWIGSVLEQAWGCFRFNAFYFSGILLSILVTFVYYFILVNANGSVLAPQIGYGLATRFDLGNLNFSMFIVFAFLFPNTQFMLYFLIPIKAKWLGVINLVVYGAEIVQCFQEGKYSSFMTMFYLIASLVNFVIFYLIARSPQGLAAAARQGKKGFAAAARHKKRQVLYHNESSSHGAGPRHRCVICGRTEVDSPQLEFRYCSKCEGNYEYCQDHLFTHEHVRRGMTDGNENGGKE